MATYQIPAPQPMNVTGDVSTNWKTFKASWDFFVIATEIEKKPKPVQAAALCSVMGADCVKVMKSLTTLSDEDKKDAERILKELGEHFIPQKHLLFERVKFGYANQTEHETIDQYVVRLRQLAETCEFATLQDSMIRDRLVMGTHDSATRDRLLRERPVPDSKRCIEALRASELSRQHKDQLKTVVGEMQDTIHEMKKQSNKVSKPSNYQKEQNINTCKYCGFHHAKEKSKCPAFGKICNKCGKQNHFASVCKGKGATQNQSSKKLHQSSVAVNYEDDSDDSVFTVHRVGSANTTNSKSKFMVPFTFHNEHSPTVTVQLDSGATCSAMSYSDLLSIMQSSKVKLGHPGGKIKLYDGSVVTPLGTYTLTVSKDSGPKIRVVFDILKKAPWPIIDGSTCLKHGWLSLGTDKSVNMLQESCCELLSTEDVFHRFNDVFTGLGCLPGQYHIEVDANVKPTQHAPRRVPVPLKDKLKAKLEEMEKQGIITKVDKPTEWISSLVAVQKADKLRICIDPRDLNKAIKRPKYQMPTVEEMLPHLSNAKVFTVLDAKDGFFQVKLDEESSYLTTFWTPFGRFRYLRMPQGISSAPEEYQRRQNEALAGLSGVEVIADDILCYGCGETMDEAMTDHDRNLLQLLVRARAVNLKLNKKKLRMRLSEVPYMGQLLTSNGLKPDPSKVSAIVNMPPPSDKKAVQRVLGCVNYLSRFLPHLSEVCEPLRKLTEKEAEFMWESQQAEALATIKRLISTTPVLKYYDVRSEVTIQCDASESGLGATLLQDGQPVAFASRALSPTERRYAQIEKECLAIVFACTRFDQYLHGRDLITVESDHKPLVPIWQKPIHSAPKRLQRMLLRLQKYNLHITYLPGSKMLIADMLSRAYLKNGETNEEDSPEYQIFQMSQEQKLSDEIAAINQLDYMRLSEPTHQQIKSSTTADATLQTLMNTIVHGWPDRRDEVPIGIREYWNFRDELTVQNGVLYKGMKVIIPTSMRPQMIARSHSSHLGPDACVRRARDVLYWPSMSAEIQDKVKSCEICNDFLAKQQKEPLMTHKIPSTPWSKVGQDLFVLNSENYLVTVDYFSDFFELDLLRNTLSTTVIEATKSHFACHGIADMVTDNGPQYISEKFAAFAREWEFEHTTSSPLHSQSNGKAESAVKIAKRLVKKAKKDKKDVQMALLEWRNTPDENGFSPVQKLMSRRTKTKLPTSEGLLKPQVTDGIYDNIIHRRQKSKLAYDKQARLLPELQVGEPIRLQPAKSKSSWEKGQCIAKVGSRSYLIETDNGQIYRRNRKFIRSDPYQEKSHTTPVQDSTVWEETTQASGTVAAPSQPSSPLDNTLSCQTAPPEENTEVISTGLSTSRSGRHIVVPAKYRDYELN